MKAEFIVSVPHSHLEDTKDGRGRIRVNDPETKERVTVEIDENQIAAELGVRAFQNKSGVAKFLHGLVIVRRVK